MAAATVTQKTPMPRPLGAGEQAIAKQLAQSVLKQGIPPTFEHLALGSVRIDSYQRDLRQTWVTKIVKEYNADLMQPIDVSLRADGSFFIIDGQHRVAAMVQLGHNVIGAMVHRGLSPSDEAVLFWLFQRERHALSAWDSFRARLVGKEPTAVGVLATVEAHGLTLGQGRGYDVAAVVTLENIFRVGGRKLLSSVLGLIRETWPMSPRRFEASIMGGLAIVLARYERADQFERQRLVNVLSVIPPSALIASARERGGYTDSRDRLDYATAKIIREQYNKRRSPAQRLPALTAISGRNLPGESGAR